MIKDIKIKNVASYDQKGIEITELKKFNFFFGHNGSGKTTISRIIQDINKYNESHINWVNNISIETYVYNKDFIQNNFSQTIKGVFTLGEGGIELEKLINETKNKKDELEKEKNEIQINLEGGENSVGLKKELENHQNKYNDIFWNIKKDKYQEFDAVFLKFHNKKKFMEEVSIKFEEIGKSETKNDIKKDVIKLKQIYKSVYEDELQVLDLVGEIDLSEMKKIEANSIFMKKIIGKNDVDIAEMINTLENSDWVRKGREYYKKNNSYCPFCQQSTTEKFRKDLDEFFDKSYERDLGIVLNLIKQYEYITGNLVQNFSSVENYKRFFEEPIFFKNLLDKFQRHIKDNLRIMRKKSSEPSSPFTINNIDQLETEIKSFIDLLNKEINRNNNLKNNLENEKNKLINNVWILFINENKIILGSYKSKKDELESKIKKQKELGENIEKDLNYINIEINKLESQIISIVPTINNINKILSNFGFNNFKLARDENDMNYKIIRNDGSDAQETLSEGEKNFLTFLYFYSLLSGGHSENNINSKKVVVFDDPISSFDSNVFLIVTTLIREVIKNENKLFDNIQQVFVLTHNTKFFHEIASNYKNMITKNATFWKIKKINDFSVIEKHAKKPIVDSYEALWQILKSEEKNKVVIANTMRRILETFVKFFYRNSVDKFIIDKFEGSEKMIYKSLISWLNFGSHSAINDEYFDSENDYSIEQYKKVFKNIFKLKNHEEHYNKMMSEDNENST
ncbi:AAA family ATPase [Mycoplasmopsis agassizii]|uniref:AAA family ATPase n=1 Tax=Mycoplasmopsis agassizii TaxID=33922 RepID=UPI003526F376